jgi:cytochrome b subunit of formate dehydrogenase
MVVLNSGRLLVKINRISAWVLLVFMILFLISGYAWWNRILLSLNSAKYIHTNLDVFLVFFFLVHVLISIRFALARWRVGHGQVISLLLIIIGVASFAAILSIR